MASEAIARAWQHHDTPALERDEGETQGQQLVASVIQQIASDSVRQFAEHYATFTLGRRTTRKSNVTHRGFALAVAMPVFLRVMSREEAELEVGELVDLIEYDIARARARGMAWNLIGRVLLFVSIPIQVVSGALLHRRKRLAQQKVEK